MNGVAGLIRMTQAEPPNKALQPTAAGHRVFDVT